MVKATKPRMSAETREMLRLIRRQIAALNDLIKRGSGGRRSAEALRVLTVEQIENLLAHAPRRIWGLIVVALYTGARMDELLALRKEDFDLKAATVRIQSHKTFGDRVMPLPQVAVSLAQEWDSNFSANNVRLLVQEASRRAGTGTVMFVDLKTTFDRSTSPPKIDLERVEMIAAGHQLCEPPEVETEDRPSLHELTGLSGELPGNGGESWQR